MSYSIYIFHSGVKESVDAGKELDDFEHPPIAEKDVARFMVRIEKYGYQLESKSSESTEYVKYVGKCPIQVSVFPNEIAFTVPFWEGSDHAIADALQDASELSDAQGTVLFNPQDNEWEA